MSMDPVDLARWTRFAAKGGIGKCTALKDCIAKSPEDLMFLQDDEIVVLMQMPADGFYLGFCEGVVGKFAGGNVKFHGKLKKPIITRRPGSVTAGAAVSPSPVLTGRPVFSSPTPSDPSSSPHFHNHKAESESEHNAAETGPSGQSNSHSHSHSPSHGRGTPSTGHDQSSRSNTRANSAEGSDSPSIETPARRSEEQQSHSLAIEVVDERGRSSNPLSPSPLHSVHTTREDKDDVSGPAVPKYVPSHRQEVVSAVYVPFEERTSSPKQVLEQEQEDAERSVADDAQTGNSDPQTTILRQRKQRESHDMSVRQAPTEEPFSPSSQYTKEGLGSEESHIVRDSTASVSDGGFGIGLSLLQGLADGDRSSKAWSDSDQDEDDIQESFPKPPANIRKDSISTAATNSPNRVTSFAKPTAFNDSTVRASDLSSLSTEKKASERSESEAGDGLQWDDDDIFDDYRYSRYSVASKGSKQSRGSTVPSLFAPSKPPPLPEDNRPSLDGGASIRHTESPQPALGAILSTPKPLNIIKNTARGPSPIGLAVSNQDEEELRALGASNTPLGMASLMREQIDNEIKNSVNQATAPTHSEGPTPTPSIENLNLESSTMNTLPPTTSNDYNGDESEDSSTDGEASPAEKEPDTRSVASAGPLSPASTSRSHSSLFLPHPGAPKPVMNNGQITPRSAAIHVATAASRARSVSSASDPSSPEHQASPNPHSPDMPMVPPTSTLHNTLAMAAQKARSIKATTLYGITQVDLLSSSGPVPIMFSLEGHPPSPRNPDFGVPRPPASPRIPSPMSPAGLGVDIPKDMRGGSPQPIPRANFFPTAGGPRPRSRSFSGFSMNNSDATEVLFPIGRSREEGSHPPPRSDLADYRASLRGSSPLGTGRSPNGSPQSRSPSRGPSRQQRPAHVPSPLSLPAINNPNASPSVNSVPLPRSPNTNPPSPNTNGFGNLKNGPGSMRGRLLRKVSSSGAIRSPSSNRNEPLPPNPPNDFRETSPTKLASSSSRRSISQAVAPKLSYEEPEGRSELSVPGQNGGSSMSRSLSLKSKLSISALRAKGSSGRPSRDGDNPMSPTTGGSPDDEDKVQIQDMEFELIRPNVRQNGFRASEEGVGAQVTSPVETGSVRSGLEGNHPPWRSESPAYTQVAPHLRSPNLRSHSVDSFGQPGPHRTAGVVGAGAGAGQAVSIEAHRIREQKWMSLISSSPASQARKSKKVKKLLLEGVPSSVRGRVWGHVIDSNARRMQGLFGQLVQKAPKKFIPLVEQDVERCFPDFAHLQDPRGSLAQVILAYTAMVPDIRYRTGLTRIAGHLLLQAPDEDAFWIFVAVMDNLLRGYYHVTNTGQFEIDASLFQHLVETAEPDLAKFLFNDCGIRPIDICGSWFSSLFAGILPPEHLYRVWDILFYEGSIYLFRVALALVSMCKSTLMSLNPARAGPEVVLEILNRPPPSAIPQDPETFLHHTFTVKMRDDDLRKQRSKKESQWKKERLAQR